MRKSLRIDQSNSRQGDKKGAAKGRKNVVQTKREEHAKLRTKKHKQRLALKGEQHSEIAKN